MLFSRRFISLTASCALLFSSGAWAQSPDTAPISAPATRDLNKAPDSVSTLAAGLLDAVVNIASSQTVKGTEQGDNPPDINVPEGSPFEDFFKDFFSNKDGKTGQQSRKVQSLGSGFVIDAKEGLIVTNNHVIADADDIEVNFTDGSKLKAKLLGKDGKTDLALLQVDPGDKKLTAVQFGDSEQARIGDWVMAIGNPFGLGGTVTLGIISARNRNINAGPYDDFIQTDAAINRGNSGGPLFDMNGKVIGINTAIISPSGGSIGIGFAIPSEMAVGVLDQLKTYGETRRGWLAIRIQPVSEDIAKSLKLPKAEGALVSGKIADAKVDNSALHDGDVIIRFAGRAIKNARDLPRIVAESPVDRVVDVVILRDGVEKKVRVKLGLLADQDASADKDNSATEPDENTPALPGEGTTPDSQTNEDDGGVAKDNPQEILKLAARECKADVFGMKLVAITELQRKAHAIAKDVEGVVVCSVAPNSSADEKRIKSGNVIVDINQEIVKTPEDVQKRLQKLRDTGRKNALLMVANPSGELRFVTMRLD